MTVSALRLKNFIAVFNQFGYQSGTIEGKTTLNDIADWRESNNLLNSRNRLGAIDCKLSTDCRRSVIHLAEFFSLEIQLFFFVFSVPKVVSHSYKMDTSSSKEALTHW